MKKGKDMRTKLMTHVVAGYPSKVECLQLMLGMQEAGVYAIEVQVPFSDPSADGVPVRSRREDDGSQERQRDEPFADEHDTCGRPGHDKEQRCRRHGSR